MGRKGKTELVDCNACHGSGRVPALDPDDGWVTCKNCKGKGQIRVPAID
jgi:DnaJ-class molecular chaperone